MLPSLKGVTVTRTFETTTWGTTLHASGTDVVAAHGRVVVQVDAALPLHSALLDVAFPGTHLAGATMADLTVVDLSPPSSHPARRGSRASHGHRHHRPRAVTRDPAADNILEKRRPDRHRLTRPNPARYPLGKGVPTQPERPIIA